MDGEVQESAGRISLLELRSAKVDDLLRYLDAVETSLSANPLLDRFGLRLDALRIPLKVIPHRLGDHEAELRRQEAARGKLRIRSSARSDDRDEDSRTSLYAMDIRPKDVTPEPLADIEPKLKLGVILGNPGSGKSEWLKDLTRRTARVARVDLLAHKALEDRVCVPVFLHLRDVGAALTGKEDLRDLLLQAGAVETRPMRLTSAERAAAALLWAASERWQKVQLPAEDRDEPVWSRGLAEVLWRKLTPFNGDRSNEIAPLLCLDGWDECGEYHDLLGSALRAYAGSTRAHIFLTSRIVGYGDNPLFLRRPRDDPNADRRELRLCPFDYGDTRDFITAFFGEARRDIGTKLIEELRGKYAVAGMAQNPLLATFLCMAYLPAPENGETLVLPLRRVELYDRILRGLLGEWPDRRAARRDDVVVDQWRKDLVEPKLELLRDLAEWLADERRAKEFVPRQVITRSELHEFVWREPDGYLALARRPATHPLHEALLTPRRRRMEELLCDDGVLMRVGSDSYAFVHLTFQEYLTAAAFGASGWPVIAERIDRISWHPAWEEAVVMLAGCLKDPGSLLNLLADKKTDDVLRHRTLLAALCLPEIDIKHRKRLIHKLGAITVHILHGAHKDFRISGKHPERFRDALAAVFVADGYYKDQPLRQYLTTRLAHLNPNAGLLLRWIGPAGATTENLQACASIIGNVLLPSGVVRVAGKAPAISLGLLGGPRFQNILREVRLVVAESISDLGPAAGTSEFLATIAALLRHENREVCEAASDVVGQLGSVACTPEILAGLVSLLPKEEEHYNEFVTEALKALGPTAATPRLLAELAACLRDKHQRVRRTALRALTKLGEVVATNPILSEVTFLMGDKDSDVRKSAASAIGNLGKRAAASGVLRKLSLLLLDEDRDVQKYALLSVGKLGQPAKLPEITTAVSALFRGKDKELSAYAAFAAQRLRSEPVSEILSILRGILRGEDPHARAAAADVVRVLCPVTATYEILTDLAPLLTDEWMHFDADDAVVVLAHESAMLPTVISTLTEMLRTTDWARSKAAGMVLKLGALVAVPQIIEAAGDLLLAEEFYVRAEAAEAIGALGPLATTPEILTRLADLLEDDDWSVRCNAVEALGSLNINVIPSSVILSVIELLCDRDDFVRSAAAKTCGMLGWRRTGAALCLSLEDMNGDWRWSTILETVSCWPDVRLFRVGNDWTLTPIEELVKGIAPFPRPSIG